MPVEALAAVTGTATMEITVSKIELLRELTATQGVVERKARPRTWFTKLYNTHKYGVHDLAARLEVVPNGAVKW